jgi:hypothetical protein
LGPTWVQIKVSPNFPWCSAALPESRANKFLNLFNFANFDLPGNMMNGLLTGAVGQINGTTEQGHNVNRVGVGTGVYSLGAPRQIEFGLRLSF